jgi:hypothetical protein
MSRISSKGIREGARAAGHGSAVPTAATPFPPRAVIDSDFARAEPDRGGFASQASAGAAGGCIDNTRQIRNDEHGDGRMKAPLNGLSL